MASAFKDKHGWIADFRPPFGRGRQRRRVRIPHEQLGGGDEREAARAFAQELDRYARLLEGHPTSEHLEHAVSIGAVTQAQAGAIAAGHALPPPSKGPARLSLSDAADAHPSTRRAARVNHADYDSHFSLLKKFTEWSGIRFVDEVRLSIVQRYIDHMRDALGLKYPSRRHRLLYLRRACRMGAAAEGLPDALAGFVLDREESAPVVNVWTPEQLCAAARSLRASGQRRALAALALGGFAGLRPSEMIRAYPGDVADGVLAVGRVIAKNSTSRRQIPLPAIAATWLADWCAGLPPDRPILAPEKRTKRDPNAPYDHRELGQWLAPILEAATGRRLEVKCLRKSFATWAIGAGAEPRLVDEYLGHKVASVSAITARHYLAALKVGELQAVAKAINKAALKIMKS